MGAYSTTPLYKKLGIKEGFSVYVKNSPAPYTSFFCELPADIKFRKRAGKNIDFIHLFVTSQSELEKSYRTLYTSLDQHGILWISWPKGSSNLKTDINRELIRSYVLDNGLVDVKVCSINDDWSALKFVYRLNDRK